VGKRPHAGTAWLLRREAGRRKSSGNNPGVRCGPVWKGDPMLLTFLLARLSRPPRYVWSPALDLDDPAIYSTLLPRAQ
jgi:hypothetical protein